MKSTRLVALVSGFGWHVQDLRRAADLAGARLEAVSFPKIVGRVGTSEARIEAGGIDLTGVDGVLVRMMPPGSLEQVVFRMDALHRLSSLGVPVMNPPRAIEAAVDKYLASALLDAAGLPVPETWVGESAEAALATFHAMGRDVVVKPLFGSEGRGLVRVSDPELAWRTFRTLERLGSILYVQRYVQNPGHDVRAFVLSGKVIGSMRRFAAEGEWRTNVAVGGRPEPFPLDRDTEGLALRAASAVGAIMAGVDLLLDVDSGRWTVLEVNAVPGWKALGATTGVDVASAILAELRDASR
ncbi:ATP-grasp domain-containing protein [Tundrisphaera lichenicola]|uniref:ATP-grasp domain-containing protein n=1 Tax=Tundrisphaera lichenicola TaxID=2029860 RepID=UPI003EBE49B3